MSRKLVPALLLISAFSVVTFSFAQQTGESESSPKLLDALRTGQIVSLEEQACGYQIQIVNEHEARDRVESLKRGQERFENITGRGTNRTPDEEFARRHWTVKAVHSDHIVLVNGARRLERLVAEQAIVEILWTTEESQD